MTCHEHGELSKVNEDECEEYDEKTMMFEHLTKDVRQLEDDQKPNLNETNIVNLGYDESIRETGVNVHLETTEKEELVKLLRWYIDVFAESSSRHTFFLIKKNIKGFAPKWKRPYLVHKVSSRGALILVEMDGYVGTKLSI